MRRDRLRADEEFRDGREFFAKLEEPYFNDESDECGGSFELIPVEELNHFLGRGENIIQEEWPKRKRKAFQNASDAYRETGLTGKEFSKAKILYLGETSVCYCEITLERCDLETIEEISWLAVTISEEETKWQCRIYDGESEETYEKYVLLSEIEEDVIERLEAIYCLQGESLPEGGRQLGQAFDNTSIIQTVEILNVGQALCTIIKDQNNAPIAFFDFGLPARAGRIMTHQAPQYFHLQQSVRRLPVFPAGSTPIVLSHWHWDHTSAAIAFASYMGRTQWFVPQKMMPSSAVTVNAITGNGLRNNIVVIQPGSTFTALRQNTSFQVGCVDGGNSRSIHAHGAYANVVTAFNNNIFLCGDTPYERICTNEGMQPPMMVDGLQVCHHGGACGQAAAVPHPNPTQQQPAAVCSCGPNSYHHPNQNRLTDLTNAGWNIHRTDQNGGYIFQ